MTSTFLRCFWWETPEVTHTIHTTFNRIFLKEIFIIQTPWFPTRSLRYTNCIRMSFIACCELHPVSTMANDECLPIAVSSTYTYESTMYFTKQAMESELLFRGIQCICRNHVFLSTLCHFCVELLMILTVFKCWIYSKDAVSDGWIVSGMQQ